MLIERTCGQPLGTAALTVEAVSADRHSAAVLGAPAGAAPLMVERLTHLADGRPVDLEYIRFRGDRLALRGQLSRGTPARRTNVPLIQTRADVPVSAAAALEAALTDSDADVRGYARRGLAGAAPHPASARP